MLVQAARVLEARKASIASAVSEQIFRELQSYSVGGLPPEESRDTVLHIIDFVIENLSRENGTGGVDRTLLPNVVSFEEGIAARRVRYRISMIDLLHGVRILREQLWKALREEFGGRDSGLDFFVLERRVNALLDHFFVGISDSYLKSQEEIMGHHIDALEKWEEVVKSASDIKLKIPCRGEYVAIVRLQAEAIARRIGFTEEEVHDIVYAVGEAGDNAIEHGVSERGVEVHYQLTADEMRVDIADFGPGFDPAGRGEEPPDPFDERGRGIFMMKALMDEAHFVSSEGGTRVLLVKRRRGEAP